MFCARRVADVVVFIGLCVAATAWGSYASGTRGVFLALELAVGVAGVCLIPAVFRWPVKSAWALAALALVAQTAAPPISVSVLHVARTQRFAVSVGVAAAGITAHLLRGLWLPMPGLPYGWWVVVVVVSFGALVGWGALAKTRAELISSLQERAQRAEAEQGRRVAEARAGERTRIAREMHDVLAHRLSLLATYAGALEYRPDAPPERVSEAAGVIRDTVHQALNELRDVIAVLRDDNSDGTERPVPALNDLPALVEESRAIGTPVQVQGVDPAVVPSTTGRTAYRVLQEALTNARKHAPGQPVSIALDGEPGADLVIDVSNPLTANSSRIPGAGTGLVGLTERVRLVGGRLDHHATSGEFRLRARLPWPA
jgi:signal transduction histidine kinase